jgi:hypothetical protein
MTWRVFYSYSSRDADWRDRLATYLAPLKRQKRIQEWHDRKIEPGADWDRQISAQLETADLFLVLISADFLASDYCFGVEMEQALTRLKRGEAKVVPVLLKPCLWAESIFSELQVIRRGAKPVVSSANPEDALSGVAEEIRAVVANPAPSVLVAQTPVAMAPRKFDSALDLVREQVRVYASLYVRTRQRMRPSEERTVRMQAIFAKMREIATAAYPLLDELCVSPSPGERLAAVAILGVFACERHLPFLAKLVRADKPFMGYQAARALRFAAGALDPSAFPCLAECIKQAEEALKIEGVKEDSDRARILKEAKDELSATIQMLGAPAGGFD